MKDRCLLFVCGTLLKGFSNHHYMQKTSIHFLGKGSVEGELYDLGEYPGAVLSTTSLRIQGELYLLTDPKELEPLDVLEEFDPENPETSLYVRRMVTVRLESGADIPAWMYCLPSKPTDARLIPNGDYANYSRS